MKLDEEEYRKYKDSIFVRCDNCGHLIQSFFDCYYKVNFHTSLEDYTMEAVFCHKCVQIKELEEKE